MKKIISVLLVIVVLAGIVAVPAAASIPVRGPVNRLDVWFPPGGYYGPTIHHHVVIPRGFMVVYIGDFHMPSAISVQLDGILLVSGRVTNAGADISGRNAWQLRPAWQWIMRNLFGGWFLILLLR